VSHFIYRINKSSRPDSSSGGLATSCGAVGVLIGCFPKLLQNSEKNTFVEDAAWVDRQRPLPRLAFLDPSGPDADQHPKVIRKKSENES
jgi:hypothetical protein